MWDRLYSWYISAYLISFHKRATKWSVTPMSYSNLCIDAKIDLNFLNLYYHWHSLRANFYYCGSCSRTDIWLFKSHRNHNGDVFDHIYNTCEYLYLPPYNTTQFPSPSVVKITQIAISNVRKSSNLSHSFSSGEDLTSECNWIIRATSWLRWW